MSKLSGILLILLAAPLFLLGNFTIAKQLVGRREAPESTIRRLYENAPAETPLFLKRQGSVTHRLVRKLLAGFAISPIDAARLPADHPLLIDISWIQRVNPYPPLLGEYDPHYQYGYVSFGYLDKNSRYHQVTYYSGESDTTPSPFVRKVRGRETGWGDYFTWYLCAISRGTKPEPILLGADGRIEKWKEPGIQVDAITWGTFEGGSYNGFEEIIIAAALTAIEAGFLTLWLALRSLRKFGRGLRRQPEP